MWRTEQPVFACRPDMKQYMQQLQQHCLELWTRELSTPRAGRKDYFLAGYLHWPPGRGGARLCARSAQGHWERLGCARHRGRSSGRHRAALAPST